jgi:hypothetical protein
MILKKLPLGSKAFSQIIDGNYLYADKTQYIYELLQDSEDSYFLSRPRRFGKTLLLNTIHELFTENRSLFKGLWIDTQSDYDFPKCPVISLTMSFDSNSPQDLVESLLHHLRHTATKYQVEVTASLPGNYFHSLITALYKKFNSKVVVLIDEYDAPVTRYMDNIELAQANAGILHDFFSVLKMENVLKCLRFTLVTGITRYALTSMDSGPNHLVDISLDPKYAGICGFTLDEFDSLFADRMESCLPSVKAAGGIVSTANVEKLKEEIFSWYNGYNWGGETRVLNPYSILNFFKYNDFTNYWIQSGRPGHLTALIQDNPLDFMEPKLELYTSEIVRKSELTMLKPVPVLFHSGYLTLDKKIHLPILNPKTNETKFQLRYSFRFPNYEVESSYHDDCFSVIFKIESLDILKTMGPELNEAFLAKDAKLVSSIFQACFSNITYHQRHEEEKNYHAFTQMALSLLGFNALSEVAGAEGRMDILIHLPSDIYLIIELKCCPRPEKLTKNEENKFLAKNAITYLSYEEVNESLATALQNKLEPEDIQELFSKLPKRPKAKTEIDLILAQEAGKILSANEKNRALAQLAREKFPTNSELNKILLKVSPRPAPTALEIDAILSSAAQDALEQIAQQDYPGLLNIKNKKIITMGMAVYGYGNPVKVIFG